MANTYTLIASNTLGSATASVTFSGIPNSYADLILKWSARAATDTAPASMGIKLNPDTGNNSATYLRVTTSSTPESLRRSGTESGNYLFDRFTSVASDETANTFSNGEMYIPSYTTNVNKSVNIFTVNETNAATTLYSPNIGSGLFDNATAVTSISIQQLSGNLAAGSTFWLYGIKNS